MKNTTKKWFSLDFELDTNNSPVKETAIKRKTTKRTNSHNSKASYAALQGSNRNNFNFYAELEPKAIEDLAVHPKKVKEVELWIDQNVVQNKAVQKQSTPFLLITGPSGSGKTATVKTICRSKKLSITEWVNPVNQDFELTRGLSQVGRFQEFLSESKWQSLFASCENQNKFILVEEFPNALLRNPEEFWSVLESCYYKASYPVIFTCTDSLNNNVNGYKGLFPPEIKEKYNITHISFNACAVTMLKSALKRAHSLVQENPELFKTPSNTTMDAIIATSMGDIRSALNQYHFACLLENADLPVVPNKYEKKPSSQKGGTKRKRSDNSSTVQVMSRDENLGLFHSLGRVLNPKRIEIDLNASENKEKKSRWTFSCSIEKLVDEFSSQPGIFTSFLFENYIKYFGDLNDVCRASELLSLSQVFLEKWANREDTLIFALWVSVLGLMVHNEHRVSRWTQIKGPTKIPNSNDSKNATDLDLRDMTAVDLYYYNVIKDKKDGHVYNVL